MIWQDDVPISAWSRLSAPLHKVARPNFSMDLRWDEQSSGGQWLAAGARRSYSDVALHQGGALLDMIRVDRFRHFDPSSGILWADAGVTLGAILRQFVPRGYFLPVTPGTEFVTLGGAVANDVHGKNHHKAGSFGRHIVGLKVLRSDQGVVDVGPDDDSGLFAATIGGLGLTGIILAVGLRLLPIASSKMDVNQAACRDFNSLCEQLHASEAAHDYSVAWLDCTASGSRLGRGIVTGADFLSQGPLGADAKAQGPEWPTDRFGGLLNSLTLKAFNELYYRMGRYKSGVYPSDYRPFFYPLDRVRKWNRLYGPRGFYQYQCVIPHAMGAEPLRDMLRIISGRGDGSFLAVLKNFGDLSSPSLLSFPQKGLTLALDFRNRGDETLKLLAQLDEVVLAAEGRLYAAKDARLPDTRFLASDGAITRFLKWKDPACQSDFAKRMGWL